ncbi:MAG: hypothetical protein ACTSV1_06135 [Alphaproteobacteria bacterium]
MLLAVAPVDYQRNLALYGVSAMFVPPLDLVTPPKRDVDEPDALAPKLREPPTYENRYKSGPDTHPVVESWRKPRPQRGLATHQQEPPDLRGAARLQEDLSAATPLQVGILPQQVAGLYRPQPAPPAVSFEFTA